MNRTRRRLLAQNQPDRVEFNGLCRATRKSILGENRLIEHHLPFLEDAIALNEMKGSTKVSAMLEELENGVMVQRFIEIVDPSSRFHKRPAACSVLQQCLTHWLTEGLITNHTSLDRAVEILSIRKVDNKYVLKSR